MIGNNQLHLNQATMIQALQMWLDETMKIAPKVTSIAFSREGHDETFIVNLSEDKKAT